MDARDVGSRLVAVVADGMGGLNFGEDAARCALECFFDHFRRSQKSSVRELLRDAVVDANKKVIALMSERGVKPNDAGTTLTSVLVDNGGEIHWVSVGDSRAYLLRRGGLHELTVDHVGYWERRYDQPHNLTSFLGQHGGPKYIDQNCRPLVVNGDDMFLLCSDGLYGALEKASILRAILNGDFAASAQRLIAAVVERNDPDQDNATALLLKVGTCK